MIRLQNNYAITSNGGSFALVTFVKGKDKEGNEIDAQKPISYHTTLESALRMNKKYEYNGNIYCEDDLSLEIDNYGGDLYDLYLALSHDDLANDVTYYYVTDGTNNYESYEELIESEFSELEVEENGAR